jgi:hypothetical protein
MRFERELIAAGGRATISAGMSRMRTIDPAHPALAPDVALHGMGR